MAALMLENKGYKVFLPLYRRRALKDGCNQPHIQLPVFSGYLFSRFDISCRLPILTTPGVLYVVGIGKMPCPIEEAEINKIQQMVNSPLSAEPWPYLKVGDQVYVDRGPFRGITGALVAVKSGYRLVLTVDLLHRAVAVEIDRTAVIPASCARSVQ
jgi:transcription antitermination factor NusG